MLGSEELHPADVLDKCATDAARRARADAKQQVRDDVEQMVCEHFPASVAIPFHRFLEGPREPLRRLLHLRDTWEALVRLTSTLAMAEVAGLGEPFGPLLIRESDGQRARSCTLNDIRSDRLSIRVGITEGILRRAGELGVSMELAKILPIDVASEMRRLNVIRNGFSHESAKSDKQADTLIREAYPMLLEILVDLRDLESVDLFRVSKLVLVSDRTIEVERLDGHAQSQRFHEISMDTSNLAVATAATDVEKLHRVLARVGARVVDLSPFMYTAEDTTGHRTRLLEFKQRKSGKWHMECIAESATESFDCSPHDDVLDRFSVLREEGSV